jgi:hypothetical protein
MSHSKDNSNDENNFYFKKPKVDKNESAGNDSPNITKDEKTPEKRSRT